MSGGWKLVEAVVDLKADEGTLPQLGRDDKKHLTKKLTKSKHKHHQHQIPTDYVNMSTIDQEKMLRFVVEQVNYLFSEANLCLDTFIRSYMDEAGYVPLALVSCYSNVAPYGIPVTDLSAAIQTFSNELEVDIRFHTVKVKEKWEMWLMPNMFGGRGLPLYSNQLVAYDQEFYDQLQYPETEGVAVDDEVEGIIEEFTAPADVSVTESTYAMTPVKQVLSAASFSSHALSPTAAEFKPGSSIGK